MPVLPSVVLRCRPRWVVWDQRWTSPRSNPMRFSNQSQLVISVLAACVVAAACTSEKIEYRSGTNFAAPATAAASYVGYYDVTNKQTVCGSCHVDYQTRWS